MASGWQASQLAGRLVWQVPPNVAEMSLGFSNKVSSVVQAVWVATFLVKQVNFLLQEGENFDEVKPAKKVILVFNTF